MSQGLYKRTAYMIDILLLAKVSCLISADSTQHTFINDDCWSCIKVLIVKSRYSFEIKNGKM